MNEPCLVIMPFGKDKDQLFYDMVYDNIILKAFEGAGVPATRIDREIVRDTLNEAIQRRLQTAPVVLADLSGNNPNVLFELGYRSAQAKPFVCISNDPSAANFWSRMFQIINYTKPDAVNEISRAIAEIIKEVKLRYKSEACLTTLAGKVRVPGAHDNMFQDRVAAWRIEQVSEQIEFIQQREWEFEAHKPSAYVAFFFEGIMDLLADGDEYLTITNAAFWSEAVVGGSGFLDKNVDAARRGAVIKRLFLIGEDEWTSSTKRPQLETFLRAHARAAQKVNSFDHGEMVVKCLLSDDLDRDLTRYGHFGLAHHPMEGTDEGCFVVVPRYESPVSGRQITHLRLIFSKGASNDPRTIDYLTKFNRLFDEDSAVDVTTFLGSTRLETNQGLNIQRKPSVSPQSQKRRKAGAKRTGT